MKMNGIYSIWDVLLRFLGRTRSEVKVFVVRGYCKGWGCEKDTQYRIYWEYGWFESTTILERKVREMFFVKNEKWKSFLAMLTSSSNQFYFTSFLLIFLKNKNRRMGSQNSFSPGVFCFICVKVFMYCH